MGRPVIENVGDTAFMVAAHRATETARSDALFRDPLANLLAGARGREIVTNLPRAKYTAWSVAIRTVVIDELIAAAVARGADTVLNLGAGLDARPYRMSLPESLRWIEVDSPEMMNRKERLLASEKPRCVVERMGLDLANVAVRAEFLANVAKRSQHVLVLTEGVVPYLTVADVATLADDLRAMSSVRGWIVDYFSPATFRYRAKAAKDFRNAPFKFVPSNWFAFFEQHGWRPTEKRFLVAEGERLQRPLPLPRAFRAWLRVIRPFVPRGRSDEMRQFAGYFLLEKVG